MKMIIGGSFQGKTQYARRKFPRIVWADGRDCPYDAVRTCGGICHLEAYIRRAMQEEEGEPYLELLTGLAGINPGIVIISDEIGYGLVPADSFERRYRETVGRICTRLASDAEQVDRVVCGVGTTIKTGPGPGKEQAVQGRTACGEQSQDCLSERKRPKEKRNRTKSR